MEQAKAIINLKEGIVQLEGPVEFVKEYLALYGPPASGPRPTPQETAVGGRGKTTRRRPKAKRILCVDAIRSEVEAGFFSEPRSAQEVKRLLTERGRTCSGNSITINLKKLVESGLLSRLGAGRGTRYQHSD